MFALKFSFHFGNYYSQKLGNNDQLYWTSKENFLSTKYFRCQNVCLQKINPALLYKLLQEISSPGDNICLIFFKEIV